MKKPLLLVTLFLRCLLTLGQITPATLPQLTPSSPQSTALAKYINYPVSYGTGLVNIDIPLYEINVKDIKIPISISYHSSGVQINANPEWVGTGWTLNAEPAVSRSIKGRPDETGILVDYQSSNPSRDQLISLANGAEEQEPDEFYYHLSSKSGGFYFSHQPFTGMQTVTHPYEPIAINYVNSSKIEITDDNGILYRFGSSSDGSRWGYDRSNSGSITCWKATEIISNQTKEKISFSYSPFISEQVRGTTDIIAVEDSIGVGGVSQPDYLTGCSNCGLPLITYKPAYSYSSVCYKVMNDNLYDAGPGQSTTIYAPGPIETMKISDINFRNGHIHFETNQYNDLSAIKIYNGQRLLKVIRFYQNVYHTNDPNSLIMKQLDSLQIGDSLHVSQTYRFKYTGNIIPIGMLNSTDFWGFYNGAGNPAGYPSVPRTTISYLDQSSFPYPPTRKTITIGFADRAPNPVYTQIGILNTITYPTGGTSHLEYENNQYLDAGVLKYGGGLRIHKIMDNDPVSGKTMTRKFTYGENENGAGFVKSLNRPEDYTLEQQNLYLEYGSPMGTTRNRLYYSSALGDAFFSDGAPVVYNEVKESRIDDFGQEIGKTIYKYNYVDPLLGTPFRVEGTSMFVDPKVDWLWGKLIAEETYKSTATGYALVSKKENRYSVVFNPAQIPIGKVYRQTNLKPKVHNDYYTYDSYENILYKPYYIQSGAIRIDSEMVKNVYGADTVFSSKKYFYNNLVNLQPSLTVTTGSDGKVIENYFIYPNDMTYADPYKEFLNQRLVGDNNITAIIERGYRKGISVENEKTAYDISNGLMSPRVITTNSGAGGVDEERIKFLLYDDQNNLLTVSKAQGPLINYVWGYGGTYPIAQVSNSDYNTIETLLGGFTTVKNFRDILTPTDAQVNSFLAPLRVTGALNGAQLTTYTFEPLVGVTSVTDAKGQITYYEYDNFQRLKNIRDQNNNIVKAYEYHYKP